MIGFKLTLYEQYTSGTSFETLYLTETAPLNKKAPGRSGHAEGIRKSANPLETRGLRTLKNGAADGNRTRTGLPPRDFKCHIAHRIYHPISVISGTWNPKKH